MWLNNKLATIIKAYTSQKFGTVSKQYILEQPRL